jgi:nicotinic acid phosphoribosyltransferase
MTQDEIIEIASDIWNSGSDFPIPSSDDIILFAYKLIEAEREACAKVCEDDAWRCKKIAIDTQNKQANASAIEASICASAIRARGQG